MSQSWQKIEARHAFFDELEAAGQLPQSELGRKILAVTLAASATAAPIHAALKSETPAPQITTALSRDLDTPAQIQDPIMAVHEVRPAQTVASGEAQKPKVAHSIAKKVKPVAKAVTAPAVRTQPAAAIKITPKVPVTPPKTVVAAAASTKIEAKPSVDPQPQQFDDKFGDVAEHVAETTGIPKPVIEGQAALESNFGESGLSKDDNNFFGVKATDNWTGEVAELPTSEFVDGQWVKTIADFRKYDNAEASFEDYGQVIKNSGYYKEAFKTNDPKEFAARVAGKYATDPKYSEKLQTMVGEFMALSEPQPQTIATPIESLPKPAAAAHPKAHINKPEVVFFSQRDRRWARKLYSLTDNKKQTMAKSGCGPTSQAMAISTLTGKIHTPEQMASWNLKHGYRTENNGTSHAAFEASAKAFGLKAEVITPGRRAIRRATNEGAVVIVSGKEKTINLWTPATTAGHYFVIDKIEGKKAVVSDPKKKAPHKMSVKRALSGVRWAIALYPSQNK